MRNMRVVFKKSRLSRKASQRTNCIKLQDQAGRVRVAAAENKAAAAKLELESLQRVSRLQCARHDTSRCETRDIQVIH